MKLKTLVGSGEKIIMLMLPFLAVGLALNIARPALFAVGGPPPFLRVISVILLITGVTIWLWSVILVLTKVPQHQLITGGPYALVKHPIYTGVALLVLPWIGFLLNTWLGVLIGTVMYVGSRIYAPEEEALLAKTFGPAWETYRRHVKIPWL